MKSDKTLTFCLILVVLLISLENYSFALTSETQIIFKIDSSIYMLNDETIQMDTKVILENNRTYAPVRFLANAIGITDNNIIWDPTTQEVTLFKNGIVMKMQLGNEKLQVNNYEINMDASPIIKNNRMLLPLRYVAESFGYIVSWDDETESIVLTEDVADKEYLIEISGSSYRDDEITIKVGDKVIWINNDSVRHSATSDDGVFDSGLLSKGESVTITFEEAGEFDYHCELHPNMKGKIIVEEEQ